MSDTRLTVYLTQEEFDALSRLAVSSGRPMSNWVVTQIRDEARKVGIAVPERYPNGTKPVKN